MGRFQLVFIVGGLLVVGLVATSGRLLVVNQPRKSDVMVVLAGETERRPARGLELLDQGYAPRLILDVPAEAKIYHRNQAEIAQEYVECAATGKFNHGLPDLRTVDKG